MSKDVLREGLAKFIPPSDHWTPIDKALYGVDDIFNVPEEEAKRLRLNAIKYSFRHHYENNKFYHEYCKDKNIKPDDIKTEKDFKKIPLIPSTFFKDHPNNTDGIIKWFNATLSVRLPSVSFKDARADLYPMIDAYKDLGFDIAVSSGTTLKEHLIVMRDPLTLKRMGYTVGKGFTEMILSDPKAEIFHMWADAKKNALGFHIVGYYFEAIYPCHYAIKERIPIFTPEKLKKKKGDALYKPNFNEVVRVIEDIPSENPLIVYSIPFSLYSLLDFMEKEENFIKLNKKSKIIVVGGKKDITGAFDITNDMLKNKIKKVTNLSEDALREQYNLSECNHFFYCCEGGYAHIPHASIQVYTLDDEMEPMPYGNKGRFAYLDPTINSYPGFIASEDKVRLLDHCPVCGRPGPVVEPSVTRMPGAKERGCAVVMAKVIKEISE
jgi:long-chain-fatty-acid---luciferin-component ligase